MLIVSTCECMVMILLKVLYTFKVCVYRFLDFSIFMILRLFTTFMPFILLYTCSFVNHFSSHLFCEVAFHYLHMLETTTLVLTGFYYVKSFVCIDCINVRK